MLANAPESSGRPGGFPPWAELLERFYQPTGLAVPALEELNGAEVPSPYQGLLVHSSDMTPTLAHFYGQTLRIKVLGRELVEDSYKREVVLWLSENGQPVEYGVIRIHLQRLPPNARRLVLGEERPLGDILQREAIPHLSWPQAFFRLKADAHTGAALGVQRAEFLYGRRNVLLDGSRHLLADVIEVLAPAVKPAGVQACPDFAAAKLHPNGRTPGANGKATKGPRPAKVRV
jgi:chorismate-pyruvate lyase